MVMALTDKQASCHRSSDRNGVPIIETGEEDAMGRTWAAVALAAGLLAMPAMAQQGPIVIGVSTAQTGPAAVAAEWELWGVNLAVEEINAAGGVLGRKLEILVMDNKCNPSE